MKVEWSEPALDELERIQLYIAQDSVHHARQFVEGAFAATDRLIDFPRAGRQVPEADDPDTRQLIFHDYRIIYRLDPPERVVVLAVVHGRRDLTRKETQPW
jgi:plasmid stabilization system protein ParE